MCIHHNEALSEMVGIGLIYLLKDWLLVKRSNIVLDIEVGKSDGEILWVTDVIYDTKAWDDVGL